MTPTITDIKYDTIKKCPHFFSRNTLKFFGQSTQMFRVRVSTKGNVYIWAPSYWTDHRTGKSKLMGHTFCQYVDHDLKTLPVDNSGDSLDRIKQYIKEN